MYKEAVGLNFTYHTYANTAIGVILRFTHKFMQLMCRSDGKIDTLAFLVLVIFRNFGIENFEK